jgi:hypothetical protein
MNEQELQFHYFKLHDTDTNNKLDGLELIHAITHYHGGGILTAMLVGIYTFIKINGFDEYS